MGKTGERILAMLYSQVKKTYRLVPLSNFNLYSNNPLGRSLHTRLPIRFHLLVVVGSPLVLLNDQASFLCWCRGRSLLLLLLH